MYDILHPKNSGRPVQAVSDRANKTVTDRANKTVSDRANKRFQTERTRRLQTERTRRLQETLRIVHVVVSRRLQVDGRGPTPARAQTACCRALIGDQPNQSDGANDHRTLNKLIPYTTGKTNEQHQEASTLQTGETALEKNQGFNSTCFPRMVVGVPSVQVTGLN